LISRGKLLEKIEGLQTKEYLEKRIVRWFNQISSMGNGQEQDEQDQEEFDQLHGMQDDGAVVDNSDNACAAEEQTCIDKGLQCNDTGCYVR
jgi:hypothetical protein